MPYNCTPLTPQFRFRRLRLEFEAFGPIRFPAYTASNTVRGALGWALHEMGSGVYQSIFEPSQTPGEGPSGLSDLPRPFVLRAAHLNGHSFYAGDPFALDVHIFSSQSTFPGVFAAAFEKVAARGFGSDGSTGRATLLRAQSLDLEGNPSADSNAISLDEAVAMSAAGVHFLTPTELKQSGGLAPVPYFPILFARIRDRLRSLCTLYGTPIKMDFDGLTARAETIKILSQELLWEKTERTSRKTGQTHPLGGFQGQVRYAGPLGEFMPFLQAACWTGVGRQTVWGKGEIKLKLGESPG